jgi:hypothetical protein
MDSKGLQLREHPVCALSAGLVAALYLVSVWGAHSAAVAAHDALGYAYIPFLILVGPGIGLLQLTSLISNPGVANMILVMFCVLFAGLNSLILYLIVYLALSHFSDRLLGV